MKHLLLFFNLLCLNCIGESYPNAGFVITNSSDQEIVEISYISQYPDTSLVDVLPEFLAVKPQGHNYDDYGLLYGLEKEIDIYKYKNTDTLSFFILSPDTILKYGWEDVRKNYRILKRYDLSYSDVESLDFKIYYPPTQAMKHMKMYPLY